MFFPLHLYVKMAKKSINEYSGLNLGYRSNMLPLPLPLWVRVVLKKTFDLIALSSRIAGVDEMARSGMYMSDLGMYDSSQEMVLSGIQPLPQLEYARDQVWMKPTFKVACKCKRLSSLPVEVAGEPGEATGSENVWKQEVHSIELILIWALIKDK